MKEDEMEALFDRLFPLNRSILGEGYNKSLDILKEHIPFNYLHIDSGRKVFDWTVPDEWIVEEAYILDPTGKKVIDYRDHNLYLLNYSAPINAVLELKDLMPHLFSIPELPEAIPYVTSYYKKNWGFCMAHRQVESLQEGKYTVVINTSFRKGNLRIGEAFLSGESSREIFLSTYLCHPSMANNELSGPLVMVYLYSELAKLKKRKYSYRFVVNPETIGSISYLSLKHGELKSKMLGGLVLTCLGGPSHKISYKSSKNAQGVLDKFFLRKYREGRLEWREFSPMGGSDERQYNSSSIALPVGQMARTIYEEHPEYHNSLDNKEFMDIKQVMRSAESLLVMFREFENEQLYITTSGFGEPFLGKHELYPSINSNLTRQETSGDNIFDGKRQQRAVMYLLNYSDGTNTLEDISLMLEEKIEYIKLITRILIEKKLLKSV